MRGFPTDLTFSGADFSSGAAAGASVADLGTTVLASVLVVIWVPFVAVVGAGRAGVTVLDVDGSVLAGTGAVVFRGVGVVAFTATAKGGFTTGADDDFKAALSGASFAVAAGSAAVFSFDDAGKDLEVSVAAAGGLGVTVRVPGSPNNLNRSFEVSVMPGPLTVIRPADFPGGTIMTR